jgi:ABC-type amino acid transport substrate-binding protein
MGHGDARHHLVDVKVRFLGCHRQRPRQPRQDRAGQGVRVPEGRGVALRPREGTLPPARGGGTTVDLSPDRERPQASTSEEAAALVPPEVSADGTLTVATVPHSAPLSVYATDNSTPVGSDSDTASSLADALGLDPELDPVDLQYYEDDSAAGLGEAAQAGIDHLIATGVYAEILEEWGLTEEGTKASALNSPGLKD